ncbi:MAG TPA: glycosyltransferase [Candidatus Binataceae bacterium]|nr:glycosyltransferase [Candidatus Binataceae bacterium]
MRALHVVAALDAARGGPSYSVPRLCRALSEAGAEVTMLSVRGADAPPSGQNGNLYCDSRFHWDYARTPVVKSLRYSSALGRTLNDEASRTAIIHNHGLWLMPNVQAGRVATRTGKPLVVSPRGMLAPAALEFSRWKKRAFWALFQGPSIRHVACLHATSEQEYEEIRSFGLSRPVAIISNGIDIPDAAAFSDASMSGERTVLSLGRLHPKKALDRLLHAWARVEGGHPDWRLRIAGPPERGYDDELRGLSHRLGLRRVAIEGPLYGEAKSAAYREADLFVLSSLNENFGLTVAEALAAGTPVVSTKGAPWSGLDVQGCGWWVEHGVNSFTAALDRAMAMPRDALAAMGARGRTWMIRDFSWEPIARDMLAVYRWLAVREEIPSIVRVK